MYGMPVISQASLVLMVEAPAEVLKWTPCF